MSSRCVHPLGQGPVLFFEKRKPNLSVMKTAVLFTVCLAGAAFAEPPSPNQAQLTLSLSSTPSFSLSDASGGNPVGARKGGFVVFSTKSREPALTGERAPVDFPGPGYRRMLENPE